MLREVGSITAGHSRQDSNVRTKAKIGVTILPSGGLKKFLISEAFDQDFEISRRAPKSDEEVRIAGILASVVRISPGLVEVADFDVDRPTAISGISTIPIGEKVVFVPIAEHAA